jgi:arylsulfatase A-like enzyme
LHYWDVHYDYAPGPPYDTMFDSDYHGPIHGDDFYFNPAVNKRMDRRDLEHVVALYDGEIRLVDDHIGKLRATLERLGLWKNTILVVAADHGDEFFEHGNKGHHRTLYEEVLHVPWVLRVPGGAVAPRRVTEEASIIDIMPTVLGLTGVAQPAGLEGTDFSSMLRGGSNGPAGRTIFAELYRKRSLNVQVAEVTDREKLIHHFNVRRTEFYDLAADPGEHQRRPLDSGDGRAFLASLRDWLGVRWQGYRKREKAHGVHTVEMDAKTAETLRALGYIQ